ncbi:MAG: phospho-N-acetylmuramoyl-pentapeptide-transferase [Chthoniobacterales bacterium]|nr:phospho-N-acetylmuramoyl-pentapeptide-transferase [Chthoniobacterales bacterium]
MLYYLYQLSDLFHGSDIAKAFHVFQYISFRAMGAGLSAFLLSLFFGRSVIKRLIALRVGQPIRTAEDLNRTFALHQDKQGTPTMGGILLVGSVLFSTILWARLNNPLIWISFFTAAYLGALGFLDDYLKVTKKKSAGISSRHKFLLQSLLAAMVTLAFIFIPSLSVQAQELYVPFLKGPLIAHLGIVATFLFYLLVIVGSSNAVNITDGLDGLAAGCTVMAAFAYAIFTYLAGNLKVATYLQIPHNLYSGELSIVSMALAGAALGFLWWNCHPARVFMGDTGSLAIGGLLGVLAISCKQEILLMLVGGIFVAEALSVILQVASFKLTGRRIFKMSPLHHHFELSGWKESTVTIRFWIMAIVLGIIGLVTLKLR